MQGKRSGLFGRSLSLEQSELEIFLGNKCQAVLDVAYVSRAERLVLAGKDESRLPVWVDGLVVADRVSAL